jgi:hypothetical protein
MVEEVRVWTVFEEHSVFAGQASESSGGAKKGESFG